MFLDVIYKSNFKHISSAYKSIVTDRHNVISAIGRYQSSLGRLVAFNAWR